MRVNPIGVNYYQQTSLSHSAKRMTYEFQPSFSGKHTCAKFWGGLFGTLATAGAIGGSIIMSGGLSIPFIIGYGAIGAASGAYIGHKIDKGSEEFDKNLDKKA